MKRTRKTGCLFLLLFALILPFACATFQPKEVAAASKSYTGWKQEGKYWYYYQKGVKKKGWLTWKGNRYFLSKKTTRMVTKLRKITGNYYYFDASGAMVKNKWVKHKNNWYFIDADGKALVNKWKTSKGKRYRLGKDGKMLLGMQKVGKKTYYFNPNDTVENGVSYPIGCRRSGSFKVSGGWRYFESNGVMLTSSWKQLNGKWYYYQQDGKRKTGWMTLDDNRYYFKSSGAMAVNETMVIGGKTWSFDKDGVATETQSFTYDSSGNVRVIASNKKIYTLQKEYAKHPGVANGKLSDKELLTATVYCEAGNQGIQGMTATAMVILNRTLAPQYNFPPSVRYVIYQKGQFSVVWDGALQRRLNNTNVTGYDTAEKAVDRAYSMYNAYKKNKTKRAKYLSYVLAKSNGKTDFDCLFFMTPAAYASSGLSSRSGAFTYKGQTFFTYWR
ncbi:MAG: hypothetical protein HFH60_02965 [Lachnospiraceae bacterium]|nr:hypothetical protein [Lachnospiraceae bacterium]MCI9545643.1 hypothetical protein [Lachnospiraceae bacterium]